MQRSTELGLYYSPYGGVGFVAERGGARKSKGFFTALRSFMRRVAAIIL